jgi:Domain of unknown function (DUF4270)
MIKTKRFRFFLPHNYGAKIFLLLVLSGLFSACDKSSAIGLDVQPESDLLNVAYSDTLTLQSITMKEDSLRTDQNLITSGIALLGKYLDPTFGEASASIFTQLRLPSSISTNSFGLNPVCDSVYLSLIYSNTFFGKQERKQQTVNVYEITSDLSQSINYYSNNGTITHSTDDLTANGGGYNFIPRPLSTDSVVVGLSSTGSTIKERAQLRVPLKTMFGQRLLDQQGTTNLQSSDNFYTYMKGLHITTENTNSLGSGEGNILNIKMPDSKMTIYYHYTGQTITLPHLDSVWYAKYDFALNSVARFNKFNHNRTTAITDIQNQLSIGGVNNDRTYVQGMAGLKTKIMFPYLMEIFKNGPVAVNKAELVIKVDNDVSYQLDTFAAPGKLVLFAIGEGGENVLIPDYSEGDTYFGGLYKSTTQEYRFNIARYIQQVLTGHRKNTGLYLIASNGSANVNRVVIGGTNQLGNLPLKLNITTTKLY